MVLEVYYRMSDSDHNSHIKPRGEHGNMASYIIGFILSLVFTLTAYYLVVNKTFTGYTLLATILGFAVLQMAVQIFFFLHLGRGPKPLYNVVFFVATLALILVVVFGSIFIMNNLQYNMSPTEVTKKLAQGEGIDQIAGEKTGACQDLRANHKITISRDKVSPIYVAANLCDTITFINEDEKVRDIAFGPHPNHENYAGQELTLHQGRAKSITLNQAGTYLFHDHLEPEITGQFTVNP